MPSWFVAGANRGIGLAIVEEVLKDPRNFVIAAAQDPDDSEGLQTLAATYPRDRLALIAFDLAIPAKIERAAEEASLLLPNGLDYYINNAAVCLQPLTGFADIDLKLLTEEIYINTVAPVQLVRALLPLIRKGQEKKIAFITSVLGSLELAPMFSELAIPYSISKAGLNMLARKWGSSLKTEGITTVLIHPGWVDTDLGNSIESWMTKCMPGQTKLSPSESASSSIKVLTEAKLEDCVAYFNYDGTRMPW
ncbi:hypothetical protein AcW1_008886 [Taiwanofungus camphoratus]|nr:hypothetical protein AcV5_006917 [Antrodia cinnamomea]KAI0949204.1 hypothetical protein AcW1_008886 [Antrodia cinnamomea]KAI0958975.1 hypothetical protein AcV7_004642 [Antrodia cinnamomea]